ncbi:MAG TPA: Mce protein [Mycobacterium sp.]|nr:Mce protein [Mycobacterium sp.]HTX93413.1 Mce protein [Mycobacterium sp.]
MAGEPDNPETDGTVEKTTEDDVTNIDDARETDGKPATDRVARWRHLITRRPLSRTGSALVAGTLIVATLTGLAGWLGYRAYEKHEAQARRDLFIQTARQGAVDLTTIDYTQVDADVQRILELATGAFRDDFEQRSKPFIEVVKAAQSKSQGTVTDAGLESQRSDSAQVLVAVAVKSRTAGGEEAPREWRMRIEVRSVGDDAKVSNVVFVP